MPTPAIAGYCCFHQLCQHRLLLAFAVSISSANTGYCCFLPHWLLLFPSVVANTSYCCFHQLCQHRLLLAITASICCAITSYCCFLPHWLLLFPSAVPTSAIAVSISCANTGYCWLLLFPSAVPHRLLLAIALSFGRATPAVTGYCCFLSDQHAALRSWPRLPASQSTGFYAHRLSGRWSY